MSTAPETTTRPELNNGDHMSQEEFHRIYEQTEEDEDGIIRLRTFPGLWIDPAALLARDYARMMATLEQGLASSEYQEFVRDLAGRQR
jgi:hypothetical protein